MAGLQSAAQQLSSYGRGKDTLLAHISPDEAQFIDQIQGGRRTNPMTGLPEYSLFGKILKAVVRVGAGIGGFMIGGPAGAAAGSAAATKLTGGSWKDALKAGAFSGIGGELGQGLTGGGWSLAGNNTALSNALGSGASAAGGASGAAAAAAPSLTGSTVGATPGFFSGLQNASALPASAISSGGALAGAAPAAAAAAPTGLAGLVSQIPGGYGGLGAAMGGLSTPLEGQPADTGPTGPPPGYGASMNLNVAPMNRVLRPYTGDPAKFGQQAGGYQFFDNVNPKPVFLAEGGGVMGPRQPGGGIGLLGRLPSPGVPSQIQSPMMGAQQPRSDMSPAGQRMQLRQAAMLGYVNAKDGGAISGPGTGTSDSVPAMLSDGEHVIDEATVRAAGHGSIERGHKAIERFKRHARAGAGMRNPSKPPAFGGR